MQSIKIIINQSSNNDGYFYDIYDGNDDTNDNSLDGGFCTTTIQNALDMATDQAKTLLNNHK